MNPKILELNEQIREAQLKIRDIQDSCIHSNVNIEAKSDYDCDNRHTFWVNVNCWDCGLLTCYDSVEDKKEYLKYTRENYENK